MHSIRIKSSQFHTVEHVNALNHENGKMIDSLLKIARRKSVTQAQQPSMHYYHNRSRKEYQDCNLGTREKSQEIITC